MTLLENPNMNCDFSNFLLSYASALSNMVYTLKGGE